MHSTDTSNDHIVHSLSQGLCGDEFKMHIYASIIIDKRLYRHITQGTQKVSQSLQSIIIYTFQIPKEYAIHHKFKSTNLTEALEIREFFRI